MSQYPELPTGCEITSLTEVLNYLGYGIDKETLARNYLDMRDTVTQGCFVEYFWGSPWKFRILAQKGISRLKELGYS